MGLRNSLGLLKKVKNFFRLAGMNRTIITWSVNIQPRHYIHWTSSKRVKDM